MGPQGSRAGVMAKDNGGTSGPWALIVRELLTTEVYKRSQGRLVRQLTCLAIWVVVLLATYRTYEYLRVVQQDVPQLLTFILPAALLDSLKSAWPRIHVVLMYAAPSVLLVIGFWFGFRVVNFPSFADFLIAVEAEMNKVSWPSRTELVRSSMVVIILMFGLAMVLFTYDAVLNWFFSHVLRVTLV